MRKAFGLAIVALLLAVPVLASAQEQDPPEGAMLIILDASGSPMCPETASLSFESHQR
jgi:hypothetical protein